jgi:glycosyltransferase involved in cell wall biosynthesis
VAISPSIRDEIVSRHKVGRADQVRVVPLGFDLSSYVSINKPKRLSSRADLQISPDALVVTTVGRLVPIKRQDVFLDMAANLSSSFAKVLFLIVGDGTLRQTLQRRAMKLGLHDRTRFLGWRSDLARIYAATDLFVLTSDNEGTPVALIEAMAAGVACISTDVGGVKDVLAEPGQLVPPGQPLALACLASELLRNQSLRSEIADRGRSKVLDEFRFERLTNDLVSLYRQLLDQPKR